MQTTDLTNLHNYDSVYGTLWLPSLRQDGEFIRVENITLAEAVDMLDNFESKLGQLRKIRNFPDFDTQSVGYLLINEISNKAVDVETLVMALSTSHIPTYRGKRPVFVSDALSAILVGRGVVYNRNHAAIDVLDPSIQDIISNVENS